MIRGVATDCESTTIQQKQESEPALAAGFVACKLSDLASLPLRLTPQASRRFYRPELDVVRFLAFFLVFQTHSLPSGTSPSTAASHVGLLQFLYVFQRVSVYGLSLFFTLSAYLICELLLREKNTNGTVIIKQFYIRRILRIWPLYFAGLAIGLVIALVLGSRQITFAWTAWATIMLGNWFVIFRGFPGNIMFPLWSISVEEQFYLFAPLAAKTLNRTTLSIFSVGLIVLANSLLFSLGSSHASDHAIWYNSFVQFENFSAGMLLCLLLHGRSPRNPVWLRLCLLVAWAMCWLVASYGFNIHTGSEVAPGSSALMGGYGLVALGCCFLLAAFLGIDKKLLPRWSIYMGRISYGLYVFHMLALHIVDRTPFHQFLPSNLVMLIKWAVAIGLTVLLASLSYHYFESPFLEMKKRHAVIESQPV